MRSCQDQLVRSSNLDAKLADVADAIKARPWFRKLVRDVRLGKKTSIVTISLGALVVTTAVGAGIELGIRHGKDLRDLAELIDKFSKRRRRR